MSSKYFVKLVLITSVFLLGCAKGISNNPSEATKNTSSGTREDQEQGSGSGPNPSPTPRIPLPLKVTELAGVWDGTCVASGSQSIKSQISLTDSSAVTDKTWVYDGKNCSGTPIAIVDMKGTFTISGFSSNVPEATSVNFNLGEVFGTPTSESVALGMNFVSYCGYSNWKANQRRSISLTNSCLKGLPVMGDQIVLIEKASLYFGNTNKSAIDRAQGFLRK